MFIEIGPRSLKYALSHTELIIMQRLIVITGTNVKLTLQQLLKEEINILWEEKRRHTGCAQDLLLWALPSLLWEPYGMAGIEPESFVWRQVPHMLNISPTLIHIFIMVIFCLARGSRWDILICTHVLISIYTRWHVRQRVGKKITRKLVGQEEVKQIDNVSMNMRRPEEGWELGKENLVFFFYESSVKIGVQLR